MRARKFYVANLLPHNAKVKTYLADMAPVIAMQPDALIMADPGLIADGAGNLARHAGAPERAGQHRQLYGVKFWQKLGVSRIIPVARAEPGRSGRNPPAVPGYRAGSVCARRAVHCLLGPLFAVGLF